MYNQVVRDAVIVVKRVRSVPNASTVDIQWHQPASSSIQIGHALAHLVDFWRLLGVTRDRARVDSKFQESKHIFPRLTRTAPAHSLINLLQMADSIFNNVREAEKQNDREETKIRVCAPLTAHSHSTTVCAPSHSTTVCAPSHSTTVCAPSHSTTVCAPSHSTTKAPWCAGGLNRTLQTNRCKSNSRISKPSRVPKAWQTIIGQ